MQSVALLLGRSTRAEPAVLEVAVNDSCGEKDAEKGT